MKRRLKFAFIIILLVNISMLQAQKKPNIIVFMVDDMGWQDTSYPFDSALSAYNKIYSTINMQKLAKMGVAFTNAYSTPVCTPSRVSLLTGMNVLQHQVTNWTSPFKDAPTGQKDKQFAEPKWNHNGLSPVPGIPHTAYATPISQILKDNGYFTIHAGKAHWASSGTPGSNPYSLGFIVNIAGTSTGRPASFLGKENFGRNTADYHGVENMQEYFGKDIYLTEALTLEALKALDYPVKNKLPFFLNLGHYALHDPLMADNRYYEKYLAQGLSKNEAKYASMIEGMDKSLGDILAYLEKHAIIDNTHIIFISDNGGLSLTPPRDGEPHTHNAPLRSGKGSIYEGGIRVPLIIKGTKGNVKGKRIDTPVIIEDIFPTILDMSKVRYSALPQKIDGRSAMGYLDGKTKNDTDSRPLFFHTPNKWTQNDGDGFNYKSAVRKGFFKLIYNWRQDSYELYHLIDDIGEKNNLIAVKEVQSIATELKEILHTRIKSSSSPVPSKTVEK